MRWVLIQILGGALLAAACGVWFGLGGLLAGAGVVMIVAGTLAEAATAEPPVEQNEDVGT